MADAFVLLIAKLTATMLIIWAQPRSTNGVRPFAISFYCKKAVKRMPLQSFAHGH